MFWGAVVRWCARGDAHQGLANEANTAASATYTEAVSANILGATRQCPVAANRLASSGHAGTAVCLGDGRPLAMGLALSDGKFSATSAPRGSEDAPLVARQQPWATNQRVGTGIANVSLQHQIAATALGIDERTSMISPSVLSKS